MKGEVMGGNYDWNTLYEYMKIESWNWFKKGDGGQERSIEGLNSIKAHYMHVWKRHNETLLYNQYNLIRRNLQEKLGKARLRQLELKAQIELPRNL
jgi:hypothetical protein